MEIGIETNPELRVGLPHNMANPVHVSMDDLAKAYGVQKQSISDMLDMIAFLESDRGKAGAQPDGSASQWYIDKDTGERKQGRARGYYQLEVGSEGGAFQRLKSARLADSPGGINVTPLWMKDSYDQVKHGSMSFDMNSLSKEQQDLLMATHILDKDINIVKALDETANPRVRQDFILNYWLDKHWAGWKGNMSERNKKEEWARERLNQGYKKNKDWASDMLAPEFNIDNMYYG